MCVHSIQLFARTDSFHLVILPSILKRTLIKTTSDSTVDWSSVKCYHPPICTILYFHRNAVRNWCFHCVEVVQKRQILIWDVLIYEKKIEVLQGPGSLLNYLLHWTEGTSYWTCMKSGISQRQLSMTEKLEKKGSLLAISILFWESNKNQVAILIGARLSKIRSSSSKIILKPKESDWRMWRRIKEWELLLRSC